MKTILIMSTLIFSLNAHSLTLKDRVDRGLEALEKKLGTGTAAQQANNLLRLKARKEVFSLQIYGRLFQDDFKFFKNMKKDFKELEDIIGQAMKWQDLLDQKNLAESKKIDYGQHLKNETANLAILLKKWNDSKLILHYKNKSAELDLNDGQTNDLAMESIKKEIKQIMEKDYDFTYGETGLHELRRSLRWPLMELELFKDLFTVTKASCPNSSNDLFSLGAKSVYLALKDNPSATTEVDYCAYMKTLGAVELLGKIKNSLEKQEALDDRLPEDLRERTNSIYKELVPSVLNKLL